MSCEVILNGSLYGRDPWDHRYIHDIESHFWVLVYLACVNLDATGTNDVACLQWLEKEFLLPERGTTPFKHAHTKWQFIESKPMATQTKLRMESHPFYKIIATFRDALRELDNGHPSDAMAFYDKIENILDPTTVPDKSFEIVISNEVQLPVTPKKRPAFQTAATNPERLRPIRTLMSVDEALGDDQAT